MKRLSFKITSFFLCITLCFTLVICDYKKVSAFDWALPTVTWEIAVPFLFGLLGVTYASEEGKNLTTEDEFFSYCEEENIPGPNVREWISDVCSGTLNQASSVWNAFKSWVSSLSLTSTEIIDTNIESLITKVLPNLSGAVYSGTAFNCAYAYYSVDSSNRYRFYFMDSSYTNTFSLSGNSYILKSVGSGSYGSSESLTTSSTGKAFIAVSLGVNGSTTLSSSLDYYFAGFTDIPAQSNFHVWTGSGVANDNFLTLDNSIINGLDLISSGATSVSIPDVITLPWDKVGENTDAISESIDSLIELVQEGVLDISDLVTTIQGLLDVITVDTTNDIVIPETVNPDTDEPVTPEDVVQDNISNSAFILKGLEKVFPFCLPYDLYNFVTLLVAEPEAPEIHFPIYDPTSGETLTIDIDFEDWEPIVILFRYIFDFLFIIGLILIARALVGGGDKA